MKFFLRKLRRLSIKGSALVEKILRKIFQGKTAPAQLKQPGLTPIYDSQLKGKVVVITGSSRGIGYALAEAFLDRGAYVVINGLNEKTLREAYQKFKRRFENRLFRGKHGSRSRLGCRS